jgi:hypothetical protein
MTLSSLRRTSPSLSMSVSKLNVTSFSCTFWLQMSGGVPTTYLRKTLKLSRTTLSPVTSFWFLVTSICRKSDGRCCSELPLNVTDLVSDLIGGLFGCDLDQVNEVSSDNDSFLDLMFTNAPVDVFVACTDSPLLKTGPSSQGV